MCIKCTGLCKKLPEPPPPKQTRRRRKAVTPAKMPGYIVMICGHYTTIEEQVILFTAAGMKPPKNLTRNTKFFCELCGRFNKPYTFTETDPKTAEEPLPF